MVLFLSETKMSANRSRDLKRNFGFPNSFGVNSDGRSGGLVVMWKNEISLDLKSYSKYHIDMWATDNDAAGKGWHFTGFYGDPRRSQRKESWRMFRFL
jgi:hypothetical protein